MLDRYEELDSLRGLAAFSVLLGHFMLIVPSSIITELINMGPLRIFVASGEAVTLFFVLSGFVLSLPFYNKRKLLYLPYVTKRFFRIYIPFYVSLLIVYFTSLTYSGNKVKLSPWFNGSWDSSFSVSQLLNHLLLIRSFPNAEYNPVLWSLVHEMRISILFPLIMFFILRFNWKLCLFIGVLCSMLGLGLYFIFNKPTHDYFQTFHYVSIFIAGALLAKYRNYLVEKIRGFTFRHKMTILLLGLFLYLYAKPAFVLKIIFGGRDPFLATILDSWIITIGASIIILMSLSIRKISKILLSKPLHFLGKISYSLYLYHCIVLFTTIHLLFEYFSLWFIWSLSLLVSLIISTISYYYVEIPSIKLGRFITNSYSKTYENIQERKAI